MPIIKSAQKKLRQDVKRNEVNARVREQFKKALKLARRDPSKKNVSNAYSLLDVGVKKSVIHKNKAARLKSRLTHALIRNQKTVTATS